MSSARYATVLMGCAAVALAACGPDKATEAAAKVARGKYLVAIMSCTDCHTPGALMGQPDMAKFLGGSDVGFFQPGVGYFYGPNLTSDQTTGLGKWREDEIVTALRTGKRPDGRMLSPIMPWMSFATLTDDDAHAIAAYLKSLPPLSNKVIGPFGPNETPTGPYEAVMMPQGAAPAMPPPTEVPAVRPPRPVD